MKTTKSFGEYPKYSLHDTRVQKIELNYLSISRIIVKVSSRSLQRLITGAEQYSKGGYGPKGIVNVNIRMYNFDDVQCTVIPSVAYGFVTGMNLQLC